MGSIDAQNSTSGTAEAEAKPTGGAAAGSKELPHDHARDDRHQPMDPGTDSDRAGEPEAPELDNMDEDRGL
jgi:hypothetical protein